ncbi:hypothetical protein HDU92_000238 [Lobulomyces angularis]|nr:hypothetical protein HDU92_000238 [Lobulomyces angularis]
MISVMIDQYVTILAIPMNPNNISQEEEGWSDTKKRIKEKYDITLLIDWVNTLETTDYAGLLGTLLSHNDSKHDIYQIGPINVVWPGVYEEYFVDLNEFISKDVKEQHIEQIFDADTVNGRHIAMPFFADYGLLYYRTDLLEKYGYHSPPETWEEMEEMMKTILKGERQTNPNMYGYAGQYKAYEGLTCNFMEWIHSARAGNVIEADGSVSIGNNEKAVEMLERMKSWIYQPKEYTPMSGLLYEESAALKLWLKGETIFMRNWPYAISLTDKDENFPTYTSNQVTTKAYNIARLPGVEKGNSASTLGGWHLGVTKQTKNLTATWLVMQELTSESFQRDRARVSTLLPTIKSLYKDPVVCQAIPKCDIFDTLQVIARPAAQTAPDYLIASRTLFTWVNNILSGYYEVKNGLNLLDIELRKSLGIYKVDLGPEFFVDFTDPLGMFFTITAIFFSAVCLIFFFIIFKNRKLKTVNHSSPTFMLLMVVGNIVGFLSILPYIGKPTNTSCLLSVWMVVLSYSIAISSMLVKNYRVFRIFRNKLAGALKLDDVALLKKCAAIISVNIFLLIIWSAFDAPKPHLLPLSNSQYWTCASTSSSFNIGINIALFIYNGFLLGVGVYLAYHTRGIPGAFNESKMIGFSIYTMILLYVILIPFVFIDSMGGMFQFIFRGAAIELSSLALLLNMFLPKIILISNQEKYGSGNSSNTTKSTGSNKTTMIKSKLGTNTSVDELDVENGSLAKAFTKAEILQTFVYLKSGKTKFQLGIAIWYEKFMVCNISDKTITFFDIDEEKNPTKGEAFFVKSMVVSDVDKGEGQFVLEATMNGVRLREVPDNQEVFADINTDQSLIIELFDYNNDAVLKRQFPCFAEYYFEELAEFNEISKENITVFYKNNLNLADYPNLKLNFP